jgi:hypothetical protein
MQKFKMPNDKSKFRDNSRDEFVDIPGEYMSIAAIELSNCPSVSVIVGHFPMHSLL